MQIVRNFLKAILMLSTIVAVTDCCSSKILFVKNHLTNTKQTQIHQINETDHQNDTDVEVDSKPEPETEEYALQTQINKYMQRIQAFISSIAMNPNKTAENNRDDDFLEYGGIQNVLKMNNEGLFKVNDSENIYNNSKLLPPIMGVKSLDNLVTPEMHGTIFNPKFNDMHYSIMKDVLSLACTGQFLTDFCLNNGRCFRYPVGNQSFFSCECADGFVGERCESKSVRGEYEAPSVSMQKPRILTARIVFSFPMLIVITLIYVVFSVIIVFRCQTVSKRHL